MNIKKKDEAIDWIRKYFIEESEDKILFLSFSRGINDKRLISNPIQAPIHEFDEIVIIVLEIRIIMNIIL